MEPYDKLLLTVVLVTMAFGVVMVYSASLVRAGISTEFFRTGVLKGNPEFYLVRSLLNVTAGLVAMFIGFKIPLAWYRRHAYHLLVLVMALLLGVLLFGHTANNSTRWYDLIVFKFQPTELGKVVLIIYLAFSMVKKADRIIYFTIGFAPHLLVLGILVVLCMKQPDFGTSLTMVAIMLAMLFVGGTKLRYIIGVGVAAIPLVYLAVKMSPMRFNRLIAFLDPWLYCNSFGYHLCESLIGVASGGFWGEGLGEGRMKLFFLPEAHTDFVLAIIIEELGYAGLLAVVLLFALFAWRGLRIAYRASSLFARFLAFGLTLQITLQAAVNAAVITGVLPTKGLTLPFISYGGSSLVFSCFAVGILLHISLRLPDEDEVRTHTARIPPGTPLYKRLGRKVWRFVS